jgi:hypothetical protein
MRRLRLQHGLQGEGVSPGGLRCAVTHDTCIVQRLEQIHQLIHSLACLGASKFELVGVLVEFLEG